MNEYSLIRNGLVLTLDRKGLTGYFRIIVKNGKIFHIDYNNSFNEKEFLLKNPGTKIIEADGKIVMPGFFNSRLVSSYSLSRFFFKKCNYENINHWNSLRLLDRYLSVADNHELMNDILKISYSRALQSGEIFISESSPGIRKDFFEKYFGDSDWVQQYFNFTVYDYTLLGNLTGQEKFISLGFRADEDINNYSLTSIKKALSENRYRVFIDASLSQKTFETIKKVFGKPLINVLSEMELLSPAVVISNPTHLSVQEKEILKKKSASVLISPSDYLNFQTQKTDFDEWISSDLNIITGTGFTGSCIFSEIKILSSLVSKNNFRSEMLLKTAIQNPALVFGVSNITGSIERNKSADFIILSLSDIRNALTIPEINSENVSEFIINNLSEKDISHVILKGEILINEGINLLTDKDKILKRTAEISGKTYSAGKYFEYKEKYLRRGRVGNLNAEESEDTEEEKPEIFVDYTETGNEYTGEGEFTIIGKKEEDFEKAREHEVSEDFTENINELPTLEGGLNLIETDEDSQKIVSPHKKVKGIKHSKTESDNYETQPEIKKPEISIDTPLKFGEYNDEAEKEMKEDIEDKEKLSAESGKESAIKLIKKTKLKFGFGDSDKQK